MSFKKIKNIYLYYKFKQNTLVTLAASNALKRSRYILNVGLDYFPNVTPILGTTRADNSLYGRRRRREY